MAPFIERKLVIAGVEVKPGARITYRPNLELRFSITTVCLDVDPDRWIGEVRLGSRIVARTEPMGRYDEAGQAAELLLTDRFAELFGITG